MLRVFVFRHCERSEAIYFHLVRRSVSFFFLPLAPSKGGELNFPRWRGIKGVEKRKARDCFVVSLLAMTQKAKGRR